MTPTVWFDRGFSSVRDAVRLVHAGSSGRVRVVASHSDPFAPVLAAADIGIVEPSGLDEAALLAWRLQVCREHQVDLYVPQAARAAVSRQRTAFESAGVKVMVAGGPDTLEQLEDKTRFYAAASEAGLPTPWCVEVGDAESFERATVDGRARGHTLCVKPPVGVFAAGYWRLDDRAPLFDQLMDGRGRALHPGVLRLALAEAPAHARLLVMQHLPGCEWSVDVACRDGRTLAAVGRRKIGTRQRLEIDGAPIQLAISAVEHFGLSGLVNVQLKAAEPGEGDPRLLEINTRVSGGLLYTALSGINLPWQAVGSWLELIDAGARPTAPGRDIAPVSDAATVDAGPTLHASDLWRAAANG